MAEPRSARLLAGHLLLAFCLSLAVAMQVESEGWNIFVMIASSALINPLMAGLSQIPDIAKHWSGPELVWSWQVSAILARNAAFLLVPLAQAWGGVSDAPVPCPGAQLALSPAAHGTDGFFAAVLEKRL